MPQVRIKLLSSGRTNVHGLYYIYERYIQSNTGTPLVKTTSICPSVFYVW